MLKKLAIKNVALIDNAEIVFSSGLNILSGETGSGKSVIIECLNFVLGAKADKSMISTGESVCSVTAEFDVASVPEIAGVFDEFGFEKDELLIITRRFNSDGKGDIRVNGNAVTASMLRRFTSCLVDVHGQSEHFYLLKESNQLDLIDKYCGTAVSDIKEQIKNKYSDYKEAVKGLEGLGGDEQSRMIRQDILSYQIKEIEDADIYDGEEEELVALRKKLLNREKIASGINSACDAIEGDGGALDTLQNALHSLNALSAFGEEYSAVADRLDSLNIELKDVADTLSSLGGDDDEEYSLEATEERLEVIKKLRKKYGADYSEIMNFLEKAKEEYDKLSRFGELAEEYENKKGIAEDKLYALYKKLSAARKKGAEEFASGVTKELTELGMGKAVFDIKFEELPDKENCAFNASGQDKLEFLFSANMGEPLKPLAKVISGGEISRFMLAVKTASSKIQSVSTFVFDEIDAGISGHIASVVAEKFVKISLGTQIIAITHLPQISVMSDTGLLIYKAEEGGRTRTHVKVLDKAGKVEEITRLIGGTSGSAAAIAHAEDMIKQAEDYKQRLK